MDEDGIIQICELLGLQHSVPYAGSEARGPHVSISCPLAPVNHGDPADPNLSCSVKIVDDGPSLARCHSGNCSFHGSFLRLIRGGVNCRPKNPEFELMLQRLTALEGVTNESKNAQDAKEIQKLYEARQRKLANKDVIPETVYDQYRGKIPAYCHQRGITTETAKRWGLGYDAAMSYLVFPVRRRDQALVGMVGRHTKKRKHHNYRGLDKAKYLFGAHLLRQNTPIVVVEGCVDAVKTEQALFPGACVVASLGEGFSNHHAQTISACNPPGVYIFTDGDAAGRGMASKIAYALNDRVPMFLMECPWGYDGKKIDPADIPDWLVQRLFRDARLIKGGRIKWSEPPPKVDLTPLGLLAHIGQEVKRA